MDSGFGKSLFGYKKQDVERSISQLESESQQRIKALEEELERVKGQLRATETARAALQQKLDEASKKESAIVDLLISAREKAVQIEEEARRQAEQRLKDIDLEFASKESEIEKMRQKYDSFQQDFQGLLGRYTGMLDQLPELVFTDTDRALPSGQIGQSGFRTSLPPAASHEWSAPEVSGLSREAGGGRPPLEAEGQWQPPGASGEWQMPTASAGPAMETAGEETLFTNGQGEASEFRKALSSINKLSYEPAVEEPWASALDKLSESPAAAPASAADSELGAGQGITASIAAEKASFESGMVKPLEDPGYKPFTPFARPAVGEGAPLNRVQSPAESELPNPESAGLDKPGTESFGLETAGLDKAGTESFGLETAGLDKPGTESFGLETAGLDKAGTESFGLESAGLDKAGTESFGLESAGLDKPGFESPGQDLQPEKSLFNNGKREDLPFQYQEPGPIRPSLGPESGGPLPYKPWESDFASGSQNGAAGLGSPAGDGIPAGEAGAGSPARANGAETPVSAGGAEKQGVGSKTAAQPFAEGASLKELLERHRQEMQRRNQDSGQQNGTLHLDVSEEDRKFWS